MERLLRPVSGKCISVNEILAALEIVWDKDIVFRIAMTTASVSWLTIVLGATRGVKAFMSELLVCAFKSL